MVRKYSPTTLSKKANETGELLTQRETDEIQDRVDYLTKLRDSYLKAGVFQVSFNTEVDQMSLNVKSHVKLNLTPAQAVEIFLEHRYFSRKMISEKYGFDLLFWGDPKKAINMVHRIYDDVMKKSEQYADLISKDIVDEISVAVKQRSMTQESVQGENQVQMRSIKYIVADPVQDMGKKFETILGKLVNILEAKLNTIKTKKNLDKEDVLKIANTVKIIGDQYRLANGQATEHIAHVVKSEALDGMSTQALIKVMADQKAAQDEAVSKS